jgi:DMSO reductase anchor subunit
MTEIAVGAFGVLFALDWRNQVKRSFLITYGIIYLFFTGLTYLFQQNFSTSDLLNTFVLLDKSWTGYLAPFLLLFLILLLPYNLFLWMDRKAGIDGKMKHEEGTQSHARLSVVRVLRMISGTLATLAGLATILVMAMIYRPLAGSGLAGAFTVAGFFAATLALGGVLTAMWLGHWYLVTPALSEKPLQFAARLVLIAVVAQVICFAFTTVFNTAAAQPTSTTTTSTTTTGSTTTVHAATPTANGQVKPLGAPQAAPLSTDAISWLHILVSFVFPLVLLGFILKLIHDRSFQSATGMLYLVVVLTLAGEAMARGLFLIGLQ